MARTKKQTLVNACERRRQIQEEIRKETLAAKQKRESSSAVNANSAHNGVPIANVQTVSCLEKMDNGTDLSSDSGCNAADLCRSVSKTGKESMSSLTHAAGDSSLFNEGNLPKAVICIPDICRSPTKLAAEEPGLQDQSPKGQGSWGRASSHSDKPREESVRRCSNTRQSEKNSEDVIASLRSLKAVSEKVREEKSRKSRQASCVSVQTSGTGRRSPRQSSLLSSDAHPAASRKGLKDATSFSDEKPKVNIFTDNLGKDLGKRIRSPRRLSEDMIALPIFSARRWSNSPKENSAASYSGGRSTDEMSIYDGMETLSLHTPEKRESFKPNVSPTSDKQSSICESSSPSPSPGSSKFILLDEKGSTSTKNSTSPHRQHNVKSNDNSLCTGTSSTDFALEKCIHREIKPEPECEDILQPVLFKYAMPGVLASDQITKASVQTGNDSRKTGITSTSFPIKEDRSKHKTQEDADHQNSSTCTELMSTGMLIKCENRCLNDTVDTFFDVKTDISEDMDLMHNIKKDTEEVNNIINVKIKSSSSCHVGSDTEKDSNINKCPYLHTPTLLIPLEVAEEKPLSSLLCAMLVGGTEVANSYSQERVRVKSQGGDKSDSELDTVKGDLSHQVCRSLLPQLSTEPADLRHSIHKSDLQIVDSDILDNQDSQGLLVHNKSGDLLPCDKVTPVETTTAATTTCERAVPVKIGDVNDITDETKSVVKKQPLNFYSQLKKVNESVLKLIDIDVEDEFLQELDDDSASERNVEDKQPDTIPNIEQRQTVLYNLISSLGTRLQCADIQIPFSTPVDLEFVGKLMESCPKIAPNIMPKLKSSTRNVLLNKRLKEENVKEISQIQTGANGEELCVGEKSDGDCGGGHHDSSTTIGDTFLQSEKCDSQVIRDDETCAHKQVTNSEQVIRDDETCVHKQVTNSEQVIRDDETCAHRQVTNKHLQKVDLDARSSSSYVPVGHLENVSLLTTAVSSDVNESMDQNVNAKESTSLDDLNTAVDKGDMHKCSEVLQASADFNQSADISTSKISEIPARFSFQKSKTCDDFNERLSANPAGHTGTLRRVNSSPQMNTKQVVLPVSSSLPFNFTAKDSHTRSKLGSKIPIPGTSYVMKSKKSWRIPRTVVEPKPLSVLSELETSSSQPTSAFTCPSLQKYLNVPSNRVIVTSDMQEEMKILDAKAKEEEERNEEMMEERDKNTDDDFNLEYKNFEPDFDEVDGMLFMSFFSEIELRAHVKVEKALEWDKDDTMLRVSRAKAFEEAKTQNEDMGHVKLKHLRGQHMRWKKYRRMYSNEVKAMLEAQNIQQSHDSLPVTKKTSDISKIKGWKRKNTSAPETSSDVNDNFNWSYDAKNKSLSEDNKEVKHLFNQTVFDEYQSMFDDSMSFMSENMTAEDGDKPEMSSRSRRRQGFSHQKAHRQLFRELNMDWEDRMIHRKLGGWSLKGNRPQAFSSAAKKRKEQKSKEIESPAFELKDVNMEMGSLEVEEFETTESKDHSEDHKKKKTIRIIYPLLTEKMARNALKTLIETGDVQRGMRRKKSKPRQSSNQLPALTPLICKTEPEDETAVAHLSDSASFVLSTAAILLTPSAQPSLTSLSSPSTSVATAPLEIDLQDEPVMEGVDIAAESISSPSVTDTSSLKSCGKPGCRYGCICHLCSVNESTAPLPSPLSIQPAPACDKEYCRLGCICDSIDPERPISSKTHCRRPSCMLQCDCRESGSFDGNEDIPYLPSMRRRPKPGDRFSNLPQREKTHRSAKNLDAVTRKALMLYETSEIYCERVERNRKRPDMISSLGSSSFDGSLLGATASTTYSNATFDIDIVSDPSEDSSFQPDTFSADVPVTSEATAYTSSHPIIMCNTSPQHQHLTRNNPARLSKPAFVLDDVRQTFSIMEPSAHKRKRKSHPLSDEIFISSTCARTQPFKYLNASKGMRASVTNKDPEEVIEISPSASADSACPIPSSSVSLSSKPVDLKFMYVDIKSKQIIPKTTSVHTLASEKSQDLPQLENAEPETPVNHSVVTSPDAASHHRLKHVTSHQQTSTQNNVRNGGSQGSLQTSWHKSMVCVKAITPPSSQYECEDDVKEEVEVKLLEFAANCNWERAKREVIAKVSQCLTRGQYPQPRMMNVCEFLVEILPKAHQPTHIPAELRAKLPEQMYSIRVRITQRESLSKQEDDSDVIDLSGSSPVKSGSVSDSIESSLKESPSMSADQKPCKATSDSSFLTSSSVGISGLSKLFITSPPVSGQHHNSCNDNQSVRSLQTESAQNIRRPSLESAFVISSSDYKRATDHHTITVQASSSLLNKPKGSSFLKFGNSAAKKIVGSAFNSEGIKTATDTTTVSSSSKSVTNNTTSKKLSIKPLNISPTNQPLASKPVSSGVTPIFGPFSAKDVKYMMSGKDGTMQLIEIAPTGDKNKKLIAVPITLSKTPVDLKGKQSAVVTLPVSGTGQNRIVPVLGSPPASSQLKSTAAQQIVLRLPSTQPSPGASGMQHPVVLQPLSSSGKCHPRFQVVPLQVNNCVTAPQPKLMPTATAVQGCTSVPVTQKPLSSGDATHRPVNSSDETIMVFTAAHVKTSLGPGSSVSCAASVSTNGTEQESESINHCAAVTHSNDRLEKCADSTPTQQQNDILGCTLEKVPSEDVLVAMRATNVTDDCDHVTDLTSANADLRDRIESAPPGDGSEALHANNADEFLETNSLSLVGHPPLDEQLPEITVKTEVSADSSIVHHSDLTVKEDHLVDSALAAYSLSEVTTTSRKKYSAIFPNSPVTAKEHIPRTLHEFALTGSKRHLSAVTALEEPMSPAVKKPCLAVENPIILDEDSAASMNSFSGVQQAAASPLSIVDRPKSVMSGALSTGSSEDMLILLSSDEDIDVGEDDKPDDIISYRVRVERALENDHGSMYTKVDPATGAHCSNLKYAQSSDDVMRNNGIKYEDMDMLRVAGREQQLKYTDRDMKKINHHNQLERLRRSRMKILFDELQQHVHRERGLPKDHVMSKVKVLVEAKKVVLHLNKCVQEGNELVKQYERKNKSLLNELAALKANLMWQDVSAETISSVIQGASEKYLLQRLNTAIAGPAEDDNNLFPSSEVIHPVTIDIDIDDSQDMVNLVSPSTDGDRVSERPDITTPVYEDISDPEDASAHT